MQCRAVAVLAALMLPITTVASSAADEGQAERSKGSFGVGASAYTSKPNAKCLFVLPITGLNGARITLSFAQSGLQPPWQELDVTSLKWKRVKTVKGRNGEVSAIIVAREDGYWRFSSGKVVSEPWYLDVWPTSDLVGDLGPYDISCLTP
jgi:hypothetical protein